MRLRAMRRGGSAAAACFVFVFLAACGGGGGDASPHPSASGTPSQPAQPAAATVSAVDDARDVTWNAAAEIDVVANDTASAGTLTLVGVSTPAHGQAAVVGGKLVYVPRTGYFGTDELTYTVRADSGGALATAALRLRVEAVLQLAGTVADGAGSGAEVVVSAGASTARATADAGSIYGMALRTSRPDDFVVAEATRAGAGAPIRLRSYVGTAGALAARADTLGRVSAVEAPALDVNVRSTAMAVLALEARGGKAPATDDELAYAMHAVKPQRWLDLTALAMKTLADGASFTRGAPDTLAYLSDPGNLQRFVRAGTQAQIDDLAASRSAAWGALQLQAFDGVAAGNGRSVLFFWDGDAYLVDFRADGTALARSAFGRREATWKLDAGALNVAFATPFSRIDTFVIAGSPAHARTDMAGLIVRRVGNLPNLVTVTVPTTSEWIDGPSAGQLDVLVLPNDRGLLMQAVDPAQRMPIGADELAPGMRWAGFLGHFDATTGWNQAVLEITAPGQARDVATGAGRAFSLQGDTLDVGTAQGTTLRYGRLATSAATGEQTWLVQVPDSAGGGIGTFSIVAVSAPAALDAAAASHVWELEVDDAVRWELTLRADGTAKEDFYFNEPTPSFSDVLQWTTAAQGGLTTVRDNGSAVRTRTWTPLQRGGDGLWVLERSVTVAKSTASTATDIAFMRWVRDLGPAAP